MRLLKILILSLAMLDSEVPCALPLGSGLAPTSRIEYVQSK